MNTHKKRLSVIISLLSALIIVVTAAAPVIGNQGAESLREPEKSGDSYTLFSELSVQELLKRFSAEDDNLLNNEELLFSYCLRLEQTFGDISKQEIESLIINNQTSNILKKALLELSDINNRSLDFGKLAVVLSCDHTDSAVKKELLNNIANSEECDKYINIIIDAMNNQDSKVAAEALRILGRKGETSACSRAIRLIDSFDGEMDAVMRAAADVWSHQITKKNLRFDVAEFIKFCDCVQSAAGVSDYDKRFVAIDLAWTNDASIYEHIRESDLYDDEIKSISDYAVQCFEK